MPHALHPGCVAHPGLLYFHVAPGDGLCRPCVRNILVQRLDLAAGEDVCGGEAGASAARGSDGALVVGELQKDCKMASHNRLFGASPVELQLQTVEVQQHVLRDATSRPYRYSYATPTR